MGLNMDDSRAIRRKLIVIIPLIMSMMYIMSSFATITPEISSVLTDAKDDQSNAKREDELPWKVSSLHGLRGRLVLEPTASNYDDNNHYNALEISKLEERDEHEEESVGSEQGSSMSGRVLATVIGGALGGAVLLSAFIVGMMMCVCRSTYVKKTMAQLSINRALVDFSSSGQLDHHDPDATFSLSELSIATNGMHDTNILGTGPSSVVYSGVFADGRRVAVKKYINTHHSSVNASREHQILPSLVHAHIITLIGFTSHDPSMGRLLVFELMINGSLSYQLHDGATCNGAILGWEPRLAIALQVSKAICFLHVYAEPCNIIHGNISSDNILLDSSWNAKLGGFGSAVHSIINGDLLYEASLNKINYTRPGDSALDYDDYDLKYGGVGGGGGRSFPSKAGDVFGFGLVLLELLTGRRPSETRDWATLISLNYGDDDEIMVGNAGVGGTDGAAALDARLPLPRAAEGALEKALEVALWCVNPKEGERPTMVDVVAGLEQILQLFKQAKEEEGRTKNAIPPLGLEELD